MLSMGKYDLSNITSVSLMCRHSKGSSSSEQKKLKIRKDLSKIALVSPCAAESHGYIQRYTKTQ